MRMDAYYYAFDLTGCKSVDLILSAVACAGKGYHSTEFWNDPGHDDGPSCIDQIQDAAKEAAKHIAELEGWHTAWKAGGQPTVDRMLDERNEMKQQIRELREECRSLAALLGRATAMLEAKL